MRKLHAEITTGYTMLRGLCIGNTRTNMDLILGLLALLGACLGLLCFLGRYSSLLRMEKAVTVNLLNIKI